MEELSDEERLYQIALTQVSGIGSIMGMALLRYFGSASAIFRASMDDLRNVRGIPSSLFESLRDSSLLSGAEKELLFLRKNGIQILFIRDLDYPSRLAECVDAPLVLYYKGTANLNATRIISIVGTRRSSAYGVTFCSDFMREISSVLPNALIVSGLAYGIDINAHRAALSSGLPTVGVLAHGLDRIYPSVHRRTAVDMLSNGGLLTEFMSQTEPERFNFVRRNRIIAGLADATIVVESDLKGGSLITADMASSYCRDVFAVSGRITDKASVGCNRLIANHKADLFLSVGYFLEQMNWGVLDEKKKKNIQPSLFDSLTDEQCVLMAVLEKNGSMHIDHLMKQTQMPLHLLFSILLELEMKGLLVNLPGNFYKVVS